MVDYSVAVMGASTKRLVLIRSAYGLLLDGYPSQSRASLTRVHVDYPCHSCIRTRSISALFGS